MSSAIRRMLLVSMLGIVSICSFDAQAYLACADQAEVCSEEDMVEITPPHAPAAALSEPTVQPVAYVASEFSPESAPEPKPKSETKPMARRKVVPVVNSSQQMRSTFQLTLIKAIQEMNATEEAGKHAGLRGLERINRLQGRKNASMYAYRSAGLR